MNVLCSAPEFSIIGYTVHKQHYMGFLADEQGVLKNDMK